MGGVLKIGQLAIGIYMKELVLNVVLELKKRLVENSEYKGIFKVNVEIA